MGFSLIVLIVGILGVALGKMVRKYKMGYLVTWVNLKKYDNNKVANIMGAHVIVLGLCLISIACVNFVLKDAYADIIIAVIILASIGIELGGYYRINKYAKIGK